MAFAPRSHNIGNLVQGNTRKFGWNRGGVALLRKPAISLKRSKIGPKLLLMTNRKSHTRFRLVPKSTTLDDLLRAIVCVCRLLHSCTLLKPLVGMRCHRGKRHCGSKKIVLDRDPGSPWGTGDLVVGTCSLQRCRQITLVLLSYFRGVFIFYFLFHVQSA